MAQPATIPFGKLLVQLGDGGGTEIFASPCGLTDKSLKFSADTGSTSIPDCDDPDAPTWNAEIVKTLSAEVSGQGVMAQAAHAIWRAWFLSGQPKNVRVQVNLPLGSGGGYYAGPAILTAFSLDGAYGEKVKTSISIKNSGPWTWVPAPA